MDPNHYLSLEGLAKIFHYGGKLKEAIEYYERVLKIHPEYEITHYNLGVLYEGTGKFPEALKCFAKYLEIKQKDWKVYDKMSEICAFIGDKEQSKAYN